MSLPALPRALQALLLLMPQQRLESVWCPEILGREGRRYRKFLDFVVLMPAPLLLVLVLLLACLAVCQVSCKSV